MDIRTKVTGFQVTPEVSKYLDDRLAHLEKMLGIDAEATRCEVELMRDAGKSRHGAHMWCAEIQMLIPGNPLVRATNHASTINAAIDDAKEELARQLRRERKVHIRMWRRSGALAKRMMRFGRPE